MQLHSCIRPLYLYPILLFLFRETAVFSQTTSCPPDEDAVSTYQTFRGSNNRHATQLRNGNFNSLPVLKWECTIPPGWGGGGEGEPVIGDVNGDGSSEVVSALKQQVSAINGSTGTLIWTYTGGAVFNGSPVIADVDGNGAMDVIAASDKVYALNGATGTLIWSFTSFPVDIFNSSPAVADVVPGGSPEIILTCDNGRVYCLNGATGAMIWSYTVINTNENFWASPAVGDVNGDGQMDVIVVSPAAFNNLGGQVLALSGSSGAVIWAYTNPTFTWDIIPQSPIIADLNQDCQMEVLAPQGGKLYILKGSNGAFIDSIWYAGKGTPAVADLDGDCDLEIITGGPRAYNANGTLVWAVAVGSSGWNGPAPRVGDFNQNSPGLETVVANAYDTTQTGTNYLIRMYSSTGTLLWGYKRPGHTCEGIAIGDIDNDGCVELVFNPDCCNGKSSVIALDDISGATNCGTSSTPGNLGITASDYSPCVGSCVTFSANSNCVTGGSGWSWTFSGTIYDTPIYCFDSAGTYTVQLVGQFPCGADTSYLTLIADTCLTTSFQNILPVESFSVSPNPSKGIFNFTFGELVNEGNLSITNMLGELVKMESWNGSAPFSINLSDQPQGVYLMKAAVNGKLFYRKLVLSKPQ